MKFEAGKLYKWKINFGKGDNPGAINGTGITYITVRLHEIRERRKDRHNYELSYNIDPKLRGLLSYTMLWNIDSEDIYPLSIGTEEELSALLETL